MPTSAKESTGTKDSKKKAAVKGSAAKAKKKVAAPKKAAAKPVKTLAPKGARTAAIAAATQRPLPPQGELESLVRLRAYEIYQSGKNGDPLADWFEAEVEVRTQHSA